MQQGSTRYPRLYHKYSEPSNSNVNSTRSISGKKFELIIF